jgi:hypothetical protein
LKGIQWLHADSKIHVVLLFGLILLPNFPLALTAVSISVHSVETALLAFSLPFHKGILLQTQEASFFLCGRSLPSFNPEVEVPGLEAKLRPIK